MEDAVLAGELAVLVHLADETHHTVGALRPVGQHFDRSERGRTIGAVGVLAIVQGLKRILENEDLLALVGLADVVRVLQQIRNHDVLAADETVLQLETLGDHAHLVERLLTGVVETDVTGLRDRVRDLQQHRGLAGSRRTGQHHHRGGRETLTSHRVIEEAHPGGHPLLECLGHIDLENVRVRLETLDANRKIHRCHDCISLVSGCSILPGASALFTDSPAFFGGVSFPYRHRESIIPSSHCPIHSWC